MQIPDILKIKDPLYKKTKKYFTENGNKLVKVAILYSENQIFAVDQSRPKNLHNRYDGEFYSVRELQGSFLK